MPHYDSIMILLVMLELFIEKEFVDRQKILIYGSSDIGNKIILNVLFRHLLSALIVRMVIPKALGLAKQRFKSSRFVTVWRS